MKILGSCILKNKKWLFFRLKSMNILEISWRIQQKLLQRKEYAQFYCIHKPVTEIASSDMLQNFKPEISKLGINWENNKWTLFENLDLFGLYDYKEYKDRWAAGFQTDNEWPINDYSPTILITQREDIGDIRTNWELNRHFQFVGLAKNYYVTKDRKYLIELKKIFYDWNRNNLFLHGVQWTSAMEISIRLISWIYTYAFLKKSGVCQELLIKFASGIKIMAEYVIKHRARYSSANNHLIIEMTSIFVAGILLNNQKWIHHSLSILDRELKKQNTEDGVNKEMSLHYQTFVMEAYGIVILLLRKNNISVSEKWKTILLKMSSFVAACSNEYGKTIIFGDNDSGKILDFNGKRKNYYRYVLQLMGFILDKRFTDTQLDENIYWLIEINDIKKYYTKSLYRPALIEHFPHGGYTLIRSRDKQVLIAFDHANLGYGTIAAHGHADALSIQIVKKDKPILVDTGSFNYHVPFHQRNIDRKTASHNTVSFTGVEQAQMLGPFLWGKRYRCKKCYIDQDDSKVEISAIVEYSRIKHKRTILFDFNRNLEIIDTVNSARKGTQNWIIPKEITIENEGQQLSSKLVIINSDNKIYSKNEVLYSEEYNNSGIAKRYQIEFNRRVRTRFTILE